MYEVPSYVTVFPVDCLVFVSHFYPMMNKKSIEPFASRQELAEHWQVAKKTLPTDAPIALLAKILTRVSTMHGRQSHRQLVVYLVCRRKLKYKNKKGVSFRSAQIHS